MIEIENLTDRLIKHPTRTFDRRAVGRITHIAVHHSATDGSKTTVEGIARYHVQTNNWAGIGYHYCILIDGQVKQVNDLETIAAHVGNHNAYTVGICLHGNYTQGGPPDAQRRALAELLAILCPLLNIPLTNVWGHKSFPGHSTTICPGGEWNEWGMQAIHEAETLIEDAPRLWSKTELLALISKTVEELK